MSRSQSTERTLFGGREINIWVTEPQIILFQKADVEFVIKLVEFDYDKPEDYVLLDIQANAPTDLIQTGLKVFKQSDLTTPITALLKLDKRELLRRTQARLGRDVAILALLKSLESLTRGV